MVAVAAAALLAALAWFALQPAPPVVGEGDRTVNITLTRPGLTSPAKLAIPEAFFRKRFLRLVQKNLKGGEQKSIYLQVKYPEMVPWIGGNEKQSPNNVIDLTLSATWPGFVDRYWSEGKAHLYDFVGSSEFGIEEYRRKPELKTAEMMNKIERVFFEEGNSDSRTFLLICSTGLRCRIDAEPYPSIHAHISFPKTLLQEWRQVIYRVEQFVDSLVVEEFQSSVSEPGRLGRQRGIGCATKNAA